MGARFIEYELNVLGIRVWEDSCKLTGRSGEESGTIGPRGDLPVHVPSTADEKPQRQNYCASRPTKFCADCPGYDL